MQASAMRINAPHRRPAWAAQRGVRSAPAGRRPAMAVTAVMKNSRTAELRRLLRGDEILLGPCCHDALSARLIEQAGFPYAFMSGFCTAGARLGAPDTGLISYAEMLETGRCIHEATRSLPVIGDGDTGYGNAMNVKRTVRGYAQAGFAGILIEDQVAPKSCGHEYYAEEARYAISDPTPTPMAAPHTPPAAAAPPPPPPPPAAPSSPPERPPVLEAEVMSEPPPAASATSPSWPLPPDADARTPYTASASASSTTTSTLPTAPRASASADSGSGSSSGSASGSGPDPSYRRNRSLRVRIADGTSGLVKLETRVPAGFLNGLTALVPQVAGFNIEALMDQAMGPGGVLPPPGTPLLNVMTGNDNVQIFLE
ncbi:hypothetical protein GPECTOR_204g384 [Gonium pectorale]|uniref:Isocitrate lyase n=1 Tax=Gonium pectorale TaxID=33097 RepID=A0A150FWW1_GONPE|nr:hypothetical protein GPECTOR_204g384 [Gonium pectorale]|eukprot:KXZ42102.1 hypothetical protein GPECTOR_204g384 [Gonium pectorale]